MSAFDRSALLARGAYGREATEKDWKDGKDFSIISGPYFSIRDIEQIKKDGTSQIIFYNKFGFVAFIVDLK